MKKIYSLIIIIIFAFVSSNTCLAAYHEVNFTGSELDTTNTIQYQGYNFKEEGEAGKLGNLMSELGQEDNNGFPINDFLNYKKFQFWVLIILLASILIILSRLSKKLKKIEKEYAKKRIHIISKKNQITEKDEIIYSTQESKTIKPVFTENKEEKIKVNTQKDTGIKIEQDDPEKNENIKIVVKNETQEKSIPIEIEDADEDYIFEEDNK